MVPMVVRELNGQKLSESLIISRILQGENELYEILLRRNNQTLFRVIRGYIKEQSDIEDVMQNTYLKAFLNLDQFKHASKFSTWLIRIGINEALSRLKDKAKEYTLNDQSIHIESQTVLEIPDSNQLNPENRIIRNEAKLLLENTIDSLELKYKMVYVLKEVEGMPMKEIAACLNISVSNVKVRLHRAKNMLKEKLFERSINNEIFEFGFNRCDKMTNCVMKIILKN
jgi:RNA polymerase sigma-70 factor (ECF subfamily)